MKQFEKLIRKWTQDIKSLRKTTSIYRPSDYKLGLAAGLVQAVADLEKLIAPEPEQIEAAAIRCTGARVGSQIIHTGLNHALIIAAMVRAGYAVKGCPQGFVTSSGRFVDRVEAAKIAIAAGQIKNLKYHKTKLFSEELL